MACPKWDREYAESMKGPYKSRQLRQKVYINNSEVFHAGGYTTESGKDVLLPIDDPMLAGTKFYREEFTVDHIEKRTDNVLTNVVNKDCIEVAKEANVEIIEKAYPMDINFGGVYSPEVTVFRNASDSYAFLDEPYKVGIVSVAALSFNQKSGKDLQYKNAEGGFTPEGLEIMKNKIRTIYRLALSNGHDALVAGAFGCGAFRLPGAVVASLFHEILNEQEFKNKFRKITFAILAKVKSDERFMPFYDLFN